MKIFAVTLHEKEIDTENMDVSWQPTLIFTSEVKGGSSQLVTEFEQILRLL